MASFWCARAVRVPGDQTGWGGGRRLRPRVPRRGDSSLGVTPGGCGSCYRLFATIAPGREGVGGTARCPDGNGITRLTDQRPPNFTHPRVCAAALCAARARAHRYPPSSQDDRSLPPPRPVRPLSGVWPNGTWPRRPLIRRPSGARRHVSDRPAASFRRHHLRRHSLRRRHPSRLALTRAHRRSRAFRNRR